jgi:hypothetical protein
MDLEGAARQYIGRSIGNFLRANVFAFAKSGYANPS